MVMKYFVLFTEPEVSPVVPKITEPWEPRESGSETHSERLSNT